MSGFLEFLIEYGMPIIVTVLALEYLYIYFRVQKSTTKLLLGIDFLLISCAYIFTALFSYLRVVFGVIIIGLSILTVGYALKYERGYLTKLTDAEIESTRVPEISLIAIILLLVVGYIFYNLF